MTRLGNYTTFDAPTKNVDKAFTYLQNAFDKLGATVRKIDNQHDFGTYQSFEVDYSNDLEFVSDDDCDCLCDDCIDCQNIIEKDNFHEKADLIYDSYAKEFSEWL